jgi:hypothetical protein
MAFDPNAAAPPDSGIFGLVDAPDEAILTRVMMPRPGLKTTREWLRVRRIAPPR